MATASFLFTTAFPGSRVPKTVLVGDTSGAPSSSDVSTAALEYSASVASDIQAAIDAKQLRLVSGTDVRTVNGRAVVNSSTNITVSGYDAMPVGYELKAVTGTLSSPLWEPRGYTLQTSIQPAMADLYAGRTITFAETATPTLPIRVSEVTVSADGHAIAYLKTGYAAGSTMQVATSEDSGSTWSVNPSSLVVGPDAMTPTWCFDVNGLFVIVDSAGWTYSSLDNGVHWVRSAAKWVGSAHPTSDYLLYRDAYGWYAVYSGAGDEVGITGRPVYHTTDGLSWSVAGHLPPYMLGATGSLYSLEADRPTKVTSFVSYQRTFFVTLEEYTTGTKYLALYYSPDLTNWALATAPYYTGVRFAATDERSYALVTSSDTSLHAEHPYSWTAGGACMAASLLVALRGVYVAKTTAAPYTLYASGDAAKTWSSVLTLPATYTSLVFSRALFAAETVTNAAAVSVTKLHKYAPTVVVAPTFTTPGTYDSTLLVTSYLKVR